MPTSKTRPEPFVPAVIPAAWESLRDATCVSGSVLMLLGRTDVGKTTLARYLARESIGAGLVVGFLDADVGQSAIGPPATLGLKLLRESLRELRDVPDALYFVGATNPAEVAPEVVAGVCRLVSVAFARRADLVIVDTTGLVDGPIGYRLKTAKVEAVQPNHILAVESGTQPGELRHILRRFAARQGIQVHRVAASVDARRVSRSERQGVRRAAFARCLRDAVECRLALSEVTLCGVPLLEPAADLAGTVVGFLDNDGLTTGIGVLDSLDAEAGVLCARACPGLVRAACTIQLSRCRVPEIAEASAVTGVDDPSSQVPTADAPRTAP